jgi:hypothetical protein
MAWQTICQATFLSYKQEESHLLEANKNFHQGKPYSHQAK